MAVPVVVIDVMLYSNRHLPTDLGFPHHRVEFGVYRCEMQCAAGPGRRIVAVQQDTCAIDHTSDPVTLAIYFGKGLDHLFDGNVWGAEFGEQTGVLPLLVVQGRDNRHHPVDVAVVNEMGTVAAAPTVACRVGLFLDPLAPLPIDAAVARPKERHVEVPGVAVIGDERRPFAGGLSCGFIWGEGL